ncbi:hypothetical protein [Oryza sativa Japonica Group]|uniref:Uncharacterized protein n=1 Tax=Oryza sativa subsp. japonica TaxID=39947 RepID=Q5JMM4_ORYSJ|nr:hypothetical protein [Oryza sativa Japonica Group]BAD87279.1 hypothetical protein [Oryza sativa Japonica Group]
MVLPLVKLGSLAFRTLSKPIAARLKHNAGIHPKFRGFIIGLAQGGLDFGDLRMFLRDSWVYFVGN